MAESTGTAKPAASAASSGISIDPRQQLEVLVHETLTLRVVGREREVDQPRQSVHHERVRVVTQPVRVRHGQAVRLQELVHRDLVRDPVRHHDPRLPFAAGVERQEVPVDLDVEIPRRSPAGHPLAAGHRPAHRALDPTREPYGFLVVVHHCDPTGCTPTRRQ